VRLLFRLLNEGGADGGGNHAALLDVHAGHGVAHEVDAGDFVPEFPHLTNRPGAPEKTKRLKDR